MWYAKLLSSFFKIPQQHLEGISHWTLDSRQVQENSLYVAIQGQKVDGHRFLNEVQSKGAKWALVHESYTQKHPGLFLIRVQDVKSTLQALAKQLVQLWKPIVIAITGSVGKTSTKEFIYTLIHTSCSVHKTPGNYNSQLTLPLTILNAKEPTDYLLLEMGINQPHELEKLIAIAPPHYALLTQLAHVHIEAFGTFERLAAEKLKIFDHLDTQSAFYNLQMPFAHWASKRGVAKKITCSTQDLSADYALQEKGKLLSYYKQNKKQFTFQSPFEDSKSCYNLLFALALADTLKVASKVVQAQLNQITYPEKRRRSVYYQGVYFVDDAYNSCVDSVENALLSLPKTKGRKIAILSSMVEQGQYKKQNHRQIAQLAMHHADILIGFGDEMEEMIPIWKKSGRKWALFVSYPVMRTYVSKLIKKNDVVLLKGSRPYALERLIRDITTC